MQLNDSYLAANLGEPLASAPEPPRPLTTDEELAAQANAPDAADVLGAAFRQGNTLGSGLADKRADFSRRIDPDFSLRSALQAPGNEAYEPYFDRFHDVFNQDDFDLEKAQIDMEERDRRTLAGAGWGGTLASIAAGVADPTLAIPMLGEINEARSVASVARAAMRGGLSLGAASTVQEGILQGTQSTRTPQESALAIGSSALLGGFLGGAAKLLLPGERQAAETALDRLATRGPTFEPQSAGAAARDVLSREDLTISGGAAGAVADVTSQMNPILRGNTSPSAVARETSQSLFENTMYQAANDVGKTTGPAAESLIRVARESLYPQALAEHDAIFKEGRLAGMNMSAPEFEDAVGEAMRRNDTGENDYVSKAAKAWRGTVFDPLKKQAIDMGLLPPDVDVTTADSYFSRLWNVNRINAQETRFKAILQDHFEGALKGEFAEDTGRLSARISKLEQEKSDLQLDPGARDREIQDIEAKQQQLYSNAPDQVDLADRLSDLRQQLIDANRRGDKQTAATAREAAANLKKQGGTDLDQFLKQRADLNTRRRNLGLGYASMSDRRDAVLQNLADLEEGNRTSMLRLIRKGQKFQEDLQRLDPEKLADRVTALRESFAAEAAKAERQSERFRTQIAKLEKAKAEGKDVGSSGADLLDRQAKAEQARADRLNAISQRMETAEGMDPQAMIDEVRGGVDQLVDEVNGVSLSRGERAQRLQQKLAELDPEKVSARLKALEQMQRDLERRHLDKWEIGRGADIRAGKEPDVSDYVKDIVDATFDKLTGRGLDNSIPDNIVPAVRGPLKERTLNIPDAKVEDFLESNVKHVAESYTRKMSADTELARKFGSADMKEPLAKVQQDYSNLRAAVGAAKSVDEVRQIALNEPGLVQKLIGKGEAKADLETVKEKTLGYLRRREKTDLEDLQAGRDLLRGNYKKANMNTVWGRSVRSGLQMNMITRLGGVLLANISEIFRPAMVYGMKPFLEDGVGPLMANLKSVGVQGAIRELKLAGLTTERVLQHRIQSFGEIGDPYARGTAVERLIDNGSRIAGRWSGLAGWTDMMKTISGILAQDRLINLAREGSDVRTLSYLGLNAAMRDRVAEQIGKFAEKQDGAWIAHTERWTDDEAIRHFRAALNRDVNSVIVTKSVGDVPLFAHTPTGKILTQFKAFALASHQRVLIRGLQEGPARFMSGLISMSIVGMLSTYLRALATNRLDKIPGAEDPGWWIGEGIDNSGILSVPMEIANDLEKPFGVNPLKDPLRATGRAITGATAKPESFRNTNRNGPGALLGPAFGQAAELFNVLGTLTAKATGSKVSPGQAKSAIQSGANLTPFYSYPGLRQIIDWGVKPALNQAVGAK